jgi:Zn-dependent alcohol dehydrogenase
MPASLGYAASAPDAALAPIRFDRREPGQGEVLIEIAYCGVCHSDLHQARGEWGNTLYPCVPGHEIIGTVTAVGDGVSKFKTGDKVGVGCMVDSCGHCTSCDDGLEQYVRRCVDCDDIGFFPLNRAMRLRLAKTAGEGLRHDLVDNVGKSSNVLLSNLSHIESDISERLNIIAYSFAQEQGPTGMNRQTNAN